MEKNGTKQYYHVIGGDGNLPVWEREALLDYSGVRSGDQGNPYLCLLHLFNISWKYESQTIFTDQVSILIYFISGNDYSDYSIEDPDIPDWWKGM